MRPPADLLNRKLVVSSGSVPRLWYRIARPSLGPVYYNKSGHMRFDSNNARWGVCYLAPSVGCALAEVFGESILRRPSPSLGLYELSSRNLYRFRLAPSSDAFCPLHGHNLMNMGADMSCFVAKRSVSQEWARALMEHPSEYDGLLYIARQGAEECLALFGPKPKCEPEIEDLGALDDNLDCLEYLALIGVGVF